MRLIVERGRAAVLAEAEDFGSFVTELIGGRPGPVTAADIAGAGALHPSGDVLVTPGRVRELAGARGRDREWNRQFDAMLEWAAGRGWIDAAGRIRSHIEIRGHHPESAQEGEERAVDETGR